MVGWQDGAEGARDRSEQQLVIWIVSEDDYDYSSPLAAFAVEADAERMKQESPYYSVHEVTLYDKGARTPEPIYVPPPPRAAYRGPSIASVGAVSPLMGTHGIKFVPVRPEQTDGS